LFIFIILCLLNTIKIKENKKSMTSLNESLNENRLNSYEKFEQRLKTFKVCALSHLTEMLNLWNIDIFFNFCSRFLNGSASQTAFHRSNVLNMAG